MNVRYYFLLVPFGILFSFGVGYFISTKEPTKTKGSYEQWISYQTSNLHNRVKGLRVLKSPKVRKDTSKGISEDASKGTLHKTTLSLNGSCYQLQTNFIKKVSVQVIFSPKVGSYGTLLSLSKIGSLVLNDSSTLLGVLLNQETPLILSGSFHPNKTFMAEYTFCNPTVHNDMAIIGIWSSTRNIGRSTMLHTGSIFSTTITLGSGAKGIISAMYVNKTRVNLETDLEPVSCKAQ